MHMFTFFLCQSDGSAASFEAQSFESDIEAVARSRVLLGDHPSATTVSVWEGERPVHQEERCERFRPRLGFVRGAGVRICAQCDRPDCTAANRREH